MTVIDATAQSTAAWAIRHFAVQSRLRLGLPSHRTARADIVDSVLRPMCPALVDGGCITQILSSASGCQQSVPTCQTLDSRFSAHYGGKPRGKQGQPYEAHRRPTATAARPRSNHLAQWVVGGSIRTTSRNRTGPIFLNVLRVLDIPIALGLLAPRPLTVLHADPSAFDHTQEMYDLSLAQALTVIARNEQRDMQLLLTRTSTTRMRRA